MKTDTPTLARPGIAAMKAYTLEARSAEVKLDQNESPYDVPDSWKRAIAERVATRQWNRYPDFETARLRKALAVRYGLAPDDILVGNGSNELLLAATQTFVGPGDRVIIPVPAFALYEKLIAIAGADVDRIPFDPSTGRLPVREIITAARESGRPPVVIVCSPANPTGGILAPGELDALLDSGALVFLDRAYGDFAADTYPGVRERLVTFSSFSKSFGLAGLRIGWLSSTAENCREIRKAKLPYNLNVFSEEAALLAIEHAAEQRARVDAIIAERDRMFARLALIPGVEPFPSFANFIAFRLERDPKAVFGDLLARGILIRDISGYPGMNGCLRVSVGSRGENDRFLEALAKAMEVTQ